MEDGSVQLEWWGRFFLIRRAVEERGICMMRPLSSSFSSSLTNQVTLKIERVMESWVWASLSYFPHCFFCIIVILHQSLDSLKFHACLWHFKYHVPHKPHKQPVSNSTARGWDLPDWWKGPPWEKPPNVNWPGAKTGLGLGWWKRLGVEEEGEK